MIQELILSLVCAGTGSSFTSDSTQTFVNGQVVTTTGSPYRVSRSDRTYIEVNGQTARIKPPESIVPTLAGRGEDGWRTMTDVTVTDREIRGRFSLNWINRPTVVVNRMTGEVIISGGDALAGRAGFTGDCERASEQQRF
jgi:hypothetical protein